MSLVRRPRRRFGQPARAPAAFYRRLPSWLRLPAELIPILLAIAVGLVSGLGAVALEELTFLLEGIFDDLRQALDDLAGGWTLLLVPIIAAIPVALIVTFISPESRGAGVPYVMLAVETAGGFVRPLIAPAKVLATALTLGGGGAAGREGPIVLVAASLSSSVGRIARQPSDMLVLMVAGGAAGGIAATFNTPIAGIFFALEVVLRRFSIRNFTIVVVSAVVATLIAQAIVDPEAGSELGVLPSYALENALEVVLAVVVGLAAAGVGLLFVRTRFFTEDLFEFAGVPKLLQPVIGMGIVGALALLESGILGSGLDQIAGFAAGEESVRALGLLIGLKVLAASATIGSGASGGAFAPLLFIGAALGALMGAGFEAALPGQVGDVGAYAVVGMAAVFAAAARAPMTSVFIVFELSGYALIVPMMAAVAVATAIASLVTRDTIYNVRLRRAGLDVREEADRNPLDEISVAAMMRTDTPVVTRTATIQDLARAMGQSSANVVAVTDLQNRFIGLVSATDVTSALERNEFSRIARDLSVVAPVRVHPDDSLRHALSLLVEHDVRQLPVVARADESRLMGMLTQRDVLLAVAHPPADQQSGPTAPVRQLTGAVQIEVNVNPSSAAAGVAVEQLPLPEDAVVTAIYRRGDVVIPRHDAQIEANDLVIVLAVPEYEGAVRAAFEPPSERDRSQWWFLPQAPPPPSDRGRER